MTILSKNLAGPWPLWTPWLRLWISEWHVESRVFRNHNVFLSTLSLKNSDLINQGAINGVASPSIWGGAKCLILGD